MNNGNIENEYSLNEYKTMRELFSQDADIPVSTERRVRQTLASLEDKPAQKVFNVFGRSVQMSRRAAIAAAAALVFAVGGGTALAAGAIHSSLFDTTMGTGISDNSESNTYEDAFGNTHYYPAFERVEVDQAKAEQALGTYVRTIGSQFTNGGTTVTLRDFVMDVNGIGYLSYTLENPDGVEDLIIRYGGSQVDIDPQKTAQPAIVCYGDFDGFDEMSTDDRTVINDSLSTDTSAYLVKTFAVPFPLDKVSTLKAVVGNESVALPIDNPAPAREFRTGDGQHIFNISPLGMTSECLVPDSAECIDRELIITSADGEYVVKSDEQNINNTFFSLAYGVSRAMDEPQGPSYATKAIVFNRLVIPSEITAIRYEADHDIISGEGYVDGYAYGDTDKTEAENPFHFIRADGIEVFVLTRETVEGCSEQDLKDLACFMHGFSSFDELLADKPNATNLADKDFWLQQVSGSLTDGMMTADEAIDYYLGLLDEYYPGTKTEYVELRLDKNDDGTCSWRFVRTNNDALSDASVNANTRTLTYPEIPGLNA